MEQRQQYHTDTVIDSYYRLLESQVSKERFYGDIMRFISARPYFFAPYVELADYLESLELAAEHEAFLAVTLGRVSDFLLNRGALEWAEKNLTKKEVAYVSQALDRYTRVCGFSLQVSILRILARRLSSRAAPAPQRAPQNMALLCHVSHIEALQKELHSNEQWWLNYTARQDTLRVHKRTNAIVLRAIPSGGNEHIVLVDGPHESVRAPLATLFPQTIAVIEEFAHARGAGLGRVALVRLKPGAIVYRHWDMDPCLQRRDRFHLVVQSSEGSLMTSGIETALFKEGDVFSFDNKKMHTAENPSDEWRVHVIFDMIEKERGGISTYPHTRER